MEIAKHGQVTFIYKGDGDVQAQFKQHIWQDAWGDCSTIQISSKEMSFEETDRMDPKCDHIWHDGNKNKTGILFQALEPLNWPDDYQGAYFEMNLPGVPYRDNFGNWKGNPEEPHQPHWANEPGSVVFMPWYEPWGVSRVWHGSKKVRVWNFEGGYNDAIQGNG